MTELYSAAETGNLERVMLLVGQGTDINQVGGAYKDTALSAAAERNHLSVVQYLAKQGADMEKANFSGNTPIIYASNQGHLDVVRCLLEQGANRDKAASSDGYTPLHCAAQQGNLETAKLLMVYGADLNARNKLGELPIDIGWFNTEEIKQAIRDEPRRRMDHGHKRATEQDPNAATSVSAQHQEDEEEVEQSNKKPRLDEGAETEEGRLAEEDEDSEPSCDEEEDS